MPIQIQIHKMYLFDYYLLEISNMAKKNEQEWTILN